MEKKTCELPSRDKILSEAKAFAVSVKSIFREDLLQALLYGSCARGTHNAKSDVDIALVFTRSGRRSFSPGGDERAYACDQLELDFYTRVGMPLSLYISSHEKFKEKSEQGLGFIKSLLRDSVDLLGETVKTTKKYAVNEKNAPAHRKKLAKSTLKESLLNVQDCAYRIKREQYRGAAESLFCALFRLAQSVFFAQGEDPPHRREFNLKLGEILNRAGLTEGYIQFYEEIENLRDIAVYSYAEDTETFTRAESYKLLKHGVPWIEQVMGKLLPAEITAPLLSLIKETRAEIDKILFAPLQSK